MWAQKALSEVRRQNSIEPLLIIGVDGEVGVGFGGDDTKDPVDAARVGRVAGKEDAFKSARRKQHGERGQLMAADEALGRRKKRRYFLRLQYRAGRIRVAIVHDSHHHERAEERVGGDATDLLLDVVDALYNERNDLCGQYQFKGR